MQRRSFLALAPLAALAAAFRSPEPEPATYTNGVGGVSTVPLTPDEWGEVRLMVTNTTGASGTTTYAPSSNITYTI